MSIAYRANVIGGKEISRKLRALSRFDNRSVFESIGAEVESQTVRRITEEKHGPNGEEWADWSESYADSKHGPFKRHKAHPGQTRKAGGHSMLELTGDLVKSIQYEVDRDEVRVGSNLVYAATHHFGDKAREIPARPFLGLGPEHEKAVEEIVTDFLEELMK